MNYGSSWSRLVWPHGLAFDPSAAMARFGRFVRHICCPGVTHPSVSNDHGESLVLAVHVNTSGLGPESSAGIHEDEAGTKLSSKCVHCSHVSLV